MTKEKTVVKIMVEKKIIKDVNTNKVLCEKIDGKWLWAINIKKGTNLAFLPEDINLLHKETNENQ